MLADFCWHVRTLKSKCNEGWNLETHTCRMTRIPSQKFSGVIISGLKSCLRPSTVINLETSLWASVLIKHWNFFLYKNRTNEGQQKKNGGFSRTEQYFCLRQILNLNTIGRLQGTFGLSPDYMMLTKRPYKFSLFAFESRLQSPELPDSAWSGEGKTAVCWSACFASGDLKDCRPSRSAVRGSKTRFDWVNVLYS